ncbi:hypothetical protein [Longimicrobium sp.]|uniref:hypothetical protein n=1 Tax=Longimicrobium sp. TaxID=2029185 RepID=UPI003B3BD024
MGRILGVLFLLLATVLLVPSLRARARPQIEYVLNPVYRWEAKNRVHAIQRVLERERSQGAGIPRPREFNRFLASREGAQAALDPWDQPYYLSTTRRTFRVGSAGPDRVPRTADDILSEAQPLAPPPPGGGRVRR